LNLFRILQESLNNSSKHGKAETVYVALEIKRKWLILTVRDDGQGMKPTKKRREHVTSAKERGGLGLLGIKERVALLSGEFSIESVPSRGTTIIVKIPMPAECQPSRTRGSAIPQATSG
jgi:two-component system sensor histidine kinase DegS